MHKNPQNPQEVAKTFLEILEKFNPYHDKLGRFTSASGAGSVSAVDSNGDTLSKEQQAYFKDSKVRDENGNLRTMYHGSVEDFDTFDKDQIRAVDYDAEFNGFWFSSERGASPAMASANYTKEVYLDIKNPAPTDVWRKVVKEVRDDVRENGVDGVRWEARSTNDEVRFRLQEMGYDGIHWDGVPDVDWNALEKNGIVQFETVNGKKYELESFRHLENEKRLAEEFPEGFNLNWTNGENITTYTDRADFVSEQEEVWVAFEPTQIKAVSNKTPSSDASINKSGIAKTFLEIVKFNPYHGKDGRFTSANGAGAAAASTAWSKKMDEEQEAILSKSVNKQAMFLWKSGFLDHDEAVEAMEDENTEIHIRNYFAIMKANGDPTSTKPLSDNKANRNSDVDSGKYKDHDDAKKGYIKEKTGVDDEEAAKISKEITTWTSNAWDDADTATIDKFIEKDHTYDGEIHRGMKFSAEDFDSFMANVQPGSTIGMKRNSSWSSDKADAATFSHVADDNVNSVMIRCVKNRTASPIAYLNSQGEREVVAHSKAKWTVLNVQTIENSWGAKKAWITVVEKGDYE